MTVQLQDIRDRALRVIAYGSAKVMQEFLAEIDPNGYYPKAEKHNDLWIHIARVMCAKEQKDKPLEQGESPLPWKVYNEDVDLEPGDYVIWHSLERTWLACDFDSWGFDGFPEGEISHYLEITPPPGTLYPGEPPCKATEEA